jgi:hypothetical protein
LLRKPFSPFHRVFITDAPLEPEAIDYFTSQRQHANIELIYYEDLPLASLPLKEYERKGNATLVGNFYASVETRISVREQIGQSPSESLSSQVISKPEEIGELLIRASFLPNRLTLDAVLNEGSLLPMTPNQEWCPTGTVGYLDDQSRFWLTERAAT